MGDPNAATVAKIITELRGHISAKSRAEEGIYASSFNLVLVLEQLHPRQQLELEVEGGVWVGQLPDEGSLIGFARIEFIQKVGRG
jgi:hypothetical protein